MFLLPLQIFYISLTTMSLDNNDPHRLKYPAKLQDNINTNTLTPTRASNMSYKSCISKPSKSSNTNQYTTQKGKSDVQSNIQLITIHLTIAPNKY